ncbi:alpha/beta hydrolase [Pedobacter sp. L105]|uniref:alpha/beta hydrolase n=1 Tax=Pedobacter sp. L105 TaxID=1641871 RepID=UPI001C20620E|nr:alpha/beta hydrolase [Pedobacter sp. L105]
MKITENMLDPQLRSKYGLIKAVTFFGTKIWWVRLVNFLMRALKGKVIKELDCSERYIKSRSGGPDIRIRIFKPINHQGKLPGMVHFYGGGYKIGLPEISLETIKAFIEARPCVVIAPDYRRSLDNPFPAGFNDSYDTLLWVKENAASLGVFEDQFILEGESAGGGMTSAVALKARDTKDVKIAFQMPIYPMIDDRQITESSKIMTLGPWDREANNNGWELYLRDLKKNKQEIPSYAAPARNEDYTGFPPTITYVGTLEPFRDETIAYVDSLKKAGIPVEFQLFEGCFHGFDVIVPGADVSKKATEFKLNTYRRYYDTYFPQLSPAQKD